MCIRDRAYACHVHDDEHHEQGEQPSGKDEQVLALESLEPVSYTHLAQGLLDKGVETLLGREISGIAGYRRPEQGRHIHQMCIRDSPSST